MTTQNYQYTKISELPETTRTNNDSLLVVNVDGETKKITFSNFKTLITQAIVQSLTTIYERLGILETAVSSLLRRMNNVEDVVNDFDIDEPTDGQVLKYDATKEKWVNGSDAGTSALANLTDVDLDNVANGQILKYNSTTQKWENANESSGGSYTETVLYNGLFSTNAELELSDDIGNYNALIIWVGWTSTTANGKVPFMVDVTTFKTFTYVANPTVATDHIFCFLFSNNQYLRIARASVDTKLRLFDTQSGAVERVVGIKY